MAQLFCKGILKTLAYVLSGLYLFVSPAQGQGFNKKPTESDYMAVDFTAPLRNLNLISGLMEVSGLAIGPENTVYAHNDEYGIVYQVRLDEGEVVRAFALGDPTIERDFEGIEVVGERVYLLTSKGRIYEALIGENKTRVKYNAYDTGAGDFCETEGLTLGPPADDGSATFLILCKTPKRKTPKEKVSKDRGRIYRWSLHARRPVQTPWLDVAREDHVRTARAKGMSESTVVLKHVLRNSMIPVVTVIALGIPAIFGGAIITEQIFKVNGLGQLLIIALQGNDIPMVMTITFLLAVLIVMMNLIADILYGILDPRIRYD